MPAWGPHSHVNVAAHPPPFSGLWRTLSSTHSLAIRTANHGLVRQHHEPSQTALTGCGVLVQMGNAGGEHADGATTSCRRHGVACVARARSQAALQAGRSFALPFHGVRTNQTSTSTVETLDEVESWLPQTTAAAARRHLWRMHLGRSGVTEKATRARHHHERNRPRYT